MSDKNNKISAMTVNDMKLVLSYSYSKIINSGSKLSTFPSVMLWGPPGVGKSQGIKELAKELEANVNKKVVVTDVRLILFNPVDLRGIPTANEDKTLAIWLKPKIFQMDDSDEVINILFLDEISAAPQSVQAAAYQLTLDRTVGEHKLPDNCIVIAAGNRVTDQSVAYQMPKALANRLMHIEIKPNATAWLKWAESAGIDENVRQFLTENSNYLLDKDIDKDDLAFASPRSWEMVSNILNSVDSDPEYMRALIVGMVGSVAATRFINWYKQKKQAESKKNRTVRKTDKNSVSQNKSVSNKEFISDDATIGAISEVSDTLVDKKDTYYRDFDMKRDLEEITDLMNYKKGGGHNQTQYINLNDKDFEFFIMAAADYIYRAENVDFEISNYKYYEIIDEAKADHAYKKKDIVKKIEIEAQAVYWLKKREAICQQTFMDQLTEEIKSYGMAEEFGNPDKEYDLTDFTAELLSDAIEKGYIKENDWNLTEAEVRQSAVGYFKKFKHEYDCEVMCNITGTDKDWEIEEDDEDEIEIDLDSLPKMGLTNYALSMLPTTPSMSLNIATSLAKRKILDEKVSKQRNNTNLGDNQPGTEHLSKNREHIYNLSKSELDWRDLLKDYVKKLDPDYSFNPPDRRMDSLDVYLPSFTEDEEEPKNILFMIDTSASMRDHQIATLKKQVKKACIQYKDSMKGWLGFFDAEVIPPKAFTDSKTVQTIKAQGGGGTNYNCIFEYVNDEWVEEKPECIVVMTDGMCNYPNESITNGIPVIWVIMNSTDYVPPFGKAVYVTSN